MFVGHYGPSFAIKSSRRDIPLWIPASPAAAAVAVLVFYVVFAAVAEWLDTHRDHTAAAGS
jgi:hypothetical protein